MIHERSTTVMQGEEHRLYNEENYLMYLGEACIKGF